MTTKKAKSKLKPMGKVKPGKTKLVLARPEDLDTREGLAAFYQALTGESPTEQELDEAFADDEADVGSPS